MVFDFGGKKKKGEERIKKKEVNNFYLRVFFLKSQMWGVFIFSYVECLVIFKFGREKKGKCNVIGL